MKQKFMISKKEDGKKIGITEYAEIDKDIFSILSDETYDIEELDAARKESLNDLITAFRTNNFFPPVTSAQKVAEGVVQCLDATDNEPVEILDRKSVV